jgi:thymidylate kinase
MIFIEGVNMKASDRALNFAIRAHEGQVRKSEKDKPMIFHPMIVGDLLKSYDFDDNVVAAGYLHDVVEDTPYTINDLSRLFGGDISSLVMTASEPDKSLSWEERKKHTIKAAKDLPNRNKAVIIADKISNLEDIKILFKKNGFEDFSAFKRGKEAQKEYFEGLYKSLADGTDIDNVDDEENNKIIMLLNRFYNAILDVFYLSNYDYVRDTVFENDEEEYNRLTKLDAYKEELSKLKKVIGDNKPYIIEFTGTPRTGKTTMINVLNDFFKKGGFKVKVIDEFISSPRYKNEFVPDYKSLSLVERNLLIASAVETDLMEQIAGDEDIILADRSLFDRLVWMQRLLNKGEMSEADFNLYLDHYLPQIEGLINEVVICYTDPLTAVKRDYHANLTMEPRRFNNENNIGEYNEALKECTALINGFGTTIDTTEISAREATLRVAETLLPIMRKEYLKELKLMINEKRY